MSVEEIIIQLREIQKSNGRVFDQQFFASNEAIDNAIKLLSRPKGKWIDNSEDGYIECPFCHEATNCDDNIDELHYCWNCGAELTADMRGKE